MKTFVSDWQQFWQLVYHLQSYLCFASKMTDAQVIKLFATNYSTSYSPELFNSIKVCHSWDQTILMLGSSCQYYRLPKTICFGRGSTKTFQSNFPKKNKKKSKGTQECEVKSTSDEVIIKLFCFHWMTFVWVFPLLLPWHSSILL